MRFNFAAASKLVNRAHLGRYHDDDNFAPRPIKSTIATQNGTTFICPAVLLQRITPSENSPNLIFLLIILDYLWIPAVIRAREDKQLRRR